MLDGILPTAVPLPALSGRLMGAPSEPLVRAVAGCLLVSAPKIGEVAVQLVDAAEDLS